MISDEKVMHIVNLVIDGLEKGRMVEYPDKGATLREAKRICVQFVSQLGSCGERARQRIASMKNPPPEFSAQWDNLYQKYYEEELRKVGG